MCVHVLEIQMTSGGPRGCVEYILHSTVVVHMFDFMTYPKCSTYAAQAFLEFFLLYRIAFFGFSSLKANGLREQGKATLRLLWKT